MARLEIEFRIGKRSEALRSFFRKHNGRDVHLVIDTDIESGKDVQLNRYYWKMLREFSKFCGHSEIELHEYFLSKEGVKKRF